MNRVNSMSNGLSLHKLPHLDKCCYCVPLKGGCYIIAVLYIINGVGGLFGTSDVMGKCYPGMFVTVIAISSIVIHFILGLIAVYFLYGLIMDIPEPSIVFILGLLVMMVFTVIEAISWFFVPNIQPDKCIPPYNFGIATFLRLIVYIYELIIVNSYRNEMEGSR